MRWRVRKARTSDIRFITRTFINASRRVSEERRIMEADIYNREMLLRINNLFDRELKIFVACDKDQEDVIFGFVICEFDKIHFCYTKKKLRKFGIMKSIIVEAKKVMKDEIELSFPARKHFLIFLKRIFNKVDLNIFNI